MELVGLNKGSLNQDGRFDVMVNNVSCLNQGVVVDSLCVLVVSDQLKRLLDLHLVLVNRVGSVHGHGLFHGHWDLHCVRLGHERVVYVLLYLCSSNRNRYCNIVLGIYGF